MNLLLEINAASLIFYCSFFPNCLKCIGGKDPENDQKIDDAHIEAHQETSPSDGR